MRTLYTWNCTNYTTSLYADKYDKVCLYWVSDKGKVWEGSGCTIVDAWNAQGTIRNMEQYGRFEIESIRLV